MSQGHETGGYPGQPGWGQHDPRQNPNPVNPQQYPQQGSWAPQGGAGWQQPGGQGAGWQQPGGQGAWTGQTGSAAGPDSTAPWGHVPGWGTTGYQGTPGGAGWAPQPPQPPRRPKRRRRVVPAAVAGLLVVGAAAAGLGIGHAVWPREVAGSPAAAANSASVPQSASSGGTSTAPSASSGSQSGSSGSGSNGSGSSGSGSSGSGSSGSGSSGSGSSGSGSSGSGSSGSGGTTSPFGNNPFGGGIDPFGGGSGGSGSSSGTSSTPVPGSGAPTDTSKIAAGVDPALVDINGVFGYQGAEGAGTGIVLTSNGLVLTNNHVIDGATKLSVTDLGNGKTYNATVVGYDKNNDIAVLQLKDASGLTTAKIGNSTKVSVGDGIVGIGNAGGVGGTPSAAGGSVTALNQSITVSDELYGTTANLSGLIQTNADIEPGDSGGALVNTAGEVIGVDTAAAENNSSMAGEAEGYAIPINTAMAIADEIISGKGGSGVHVGETAALGVLVSSGTQTGSGSGYGTGNGGTSVSGASVSGVVTGGAAEKAGIVAGDVITSLDGHAVASSTALSDAMQAYHPGDKVSVGWMDATGQSHTATVTLGSGPAA